LLSDERQLLSVIGKLDEALFAKVNTFLRPWPGAYSSRDKNEKKKNANRCGELPARSSVGKFAKNDAESLLTRYDTKLRYGGLLSAT
jgi:hypothetical protein